MDIELINELLKIIKGNLAKEELQEALSHYHDYDIAYAVSKLTKAERKTFFALLDDQELSDIISYLDDPEEIIGELDNEKAADLIELMDADDALDVLEELELPIVNDIIAKMDEEMQEDIEMIKGYQEGTIGNLMTTNFIVISKNYSISQAMKHLIASAPENDNIMTLYVVDELNKFYGTIDLKDLIIARKDQSLESILKTSYPVLYAVEEIDDELLNRLKEYDLDLFPVLDKDDHLIGVITNYDIIEVSEQEMAEDYAKLAGLMSNEDIDETIVSSMKKRIPWLVLLLFIGLGISLVISGYEKVVIAIPMVIFFQSLILDMAGNSGTQSLAITIRVLTSENTNKKILRRLILKELRIGFINGTLLGIIAGIFVYCFLSIQGLITHNGDFGSIEYFKVATCVAIALLLSMTLSSFAGSTIPIFFKKVKIDPAVASGPFITSVNDLIAVISYYTLAALLFSVVF